MNPQKASKSQDLYEISVDALPLSDHGSRHRADLLLQPLHWREQLDPPRCGAHGDGGPGGCPHAGYRPGTDGGCGGHFPTPGMGRGQRSSKWQGLLLQSKHWGDQVGSSLRWKRQWLELKFPNKWMRVRFQLSFNWFTCWRLKIAKFQSAECQEMSRVYSVRRSTLYVCLDQVFLPSA